MEESTRPRKVLQYGIESSPPWYLCLMFGFQHYLTMFGSTVAVPFIVTPVLCVTDNVAKAEIIGTIFFVSGVVTFIQTTVGIRLPVVQGGTFSFIGPIFALMSLPKWKCPSPDSTINHNDTSVANYSTPYFLPNSSIDDPDSWKLRMREVQGAIIVSSLLQILVGLSGLLGFILKFIGPLTIAPTITLIGLSLFEPAAIFCSKQWGVASLTIFLITLFSQYLSGVEVPIFYRSKKTKSIKKTNYPVFRLFPIVLAIVSSWLFCVILTYSGALSEDPESPGYGARSDTKVSVLHDTKWFRFPYPGQWGCPTVSIAGVLGMMAGVLAGMLESIGDYYACARLSGAPPPPDHAVNRGIMIEGLGCMLAGFWGTGSGTTSYSENVGAIGITKVASRRVVQAGALLMMVLGVLGKIGAFFVTIPDPIIGGVFMIMFGMITAVGISNLQYVDLNSSRNLFVFGVSTFVGFTVSYWIGKNPDALNTGVQELDQIITVLLRTSMFVGGFIAVILDNTIPGTDAERGILSIRESSGNAKDENNQEDVGIQTYDIPLITEKLRKSHWASFIPVSPTYKGWRGHHQQPEDAPSNITIVDSPDNELRQRPNAILTSQI